MTKQKIKFLVWNDYETPNDFEVYCVDDDDNEIDFINETYTEAEAKEYCEKLNKISLELNDLFNDYEELYNEILERAN